MAQKKLDRLASEDFSSSSDVRLLQPSDNDHDVHTLPLEKARWTSLHKTIELGRIEEVKRILKSKEWKNVRCYKDEWTPLHEACSKGETDIAKMLLDYGADTNFTTESSWTALHVAAEIGNLAIIQLLADYGADLNCQDVTSWTPLHLSSYYGHLETVRFLLECNVQSVEVKAEALWTPLQIAAYRGHLEVVKTLIDAGANLTQEAKFPALLLACGEGHDSVATNLLERSDGVLYKKETIQDSLYRSVQIGHLTIVKQLLDRFGNVCYKDTTLQTALDVAVLHGDNELVEIVLKLGADPLIEKSKRGSCLVSRALQRGFLDIAAILLAHGVQPTKNEDHLAPFQFGSQYILLHHSSSFAMLKRGLYSDEVSHTTEALNSTTNRLTVAIVNQKSRIVPAEMEIIARNEIVSLVEQIFIKNSVDRLSMPGIVDSVAGFQNLKSLHLTNCKLEELPQLLIETAPHLEELDVSCNKIAKLSEHISKLTKLTKLVLSFNRFQILPVSVGKLDKLEVLQCNNNHLTGIPSSLSDLSQSLEVLILDENKIELSGLPNSIVDLLKKLKRFSFKKNPLTVGLLSVSTNDVIAYLEEVRENPEQNREVKLAIVGQEGVGKSSLVNALHVRNWTFQIIDPQEKTDGVEIGELLCDDIKYRTFDLAGDVDFLETHMLYCSPSTLFLDVFDLTAHVVQGHSPNQFGRMLFWLQSIFAVDPHSRTILVGTHADDARLNPAILDQIAAMLFTLLLRGHRKHRLRFQGEDWLPQCLLCQAELVMQRHTLNGVAGYVAVQNLQPCDMDRETEGIERSVDDIDEEDHPNFPHIVGYYEVSSVAKLPRKLAHFQNMSIEQLKSAITREGRELIGKNPTIPRKWVEVRQDILQRIHTDDCFRQQPVISLEEYRDVARRHGVSREDRFLAMLHYFHYLGYFLYFDDGPDVVVLDPQWLARQICTLISYKKSWIEGGFLDHKILPQAWSHIGSDYQVKLLELFRQLALCFPVYSEKKELFPCRLPIGYPDEDMWPCHPDVDQRQLTLSQKFDFIPIGFFGKLIVAINKGKDKFVTMTKPLYLANHIVYITEETPAACGLCVSHSCQDLSSTEVPRHRVHLELRAYCLSLDTTVRGPRPCCMMESLNSKIRGLLQTVNVGVKSSLVCPKCVAIFKDPPFLFAEENLRVVAATCGYGHDLGTWDHVLSGRCVIPVDVDHVLGKLEERLEDRHCPRLFTLLPINKEGLPFKEFLVHSLLKDGYEVHLLCECPGEWHFLRSPGYRISKPKAFVRKYGKRVYEVLKLVSHLETPLKAAAYVSLHPEIGEAAAVALVAGKLANTLNKVLQDFEQVYPDLCSRRQSSSSVDAAALMRSEGLNRRELARFLNVADEEQRFGALLPTRVGNSILWLCEQHYLEKKQVGFKL